MDSSEETLFPSLAAREALKTAISVTVSIGIALAMGWEKPHWAAFAVAFVSLATEGQSLNRALERMGGTLVAVFFAFVFLSWFPQDRWPFMAIACLYVCICAYLMQGKKLSYFWYASGFISTVIVADSHDSASSFQIAVERSQETGLGILVHGIVSSILWPVTTRSDLIEKATALIGVQGQLLKGYREVRQGQSTTKEFRERRAEMLQLLAQVSQKLESAERDDFRVSAKRPQWREFLSLSHELAEEAGHWRTCLPDLIDLPMDRLVPNLDEFELELVRRYESIEGIASGKDLDIDLEPIELELSASAADAVTPIQLAALETGIEHLKRIEWGTRALFECISELSEQSSGKARRGRAQRRLPFASPYPDRMLGVSTVFFAFWASFLLTVYVPDMPGGAAFWQMSTLYAFLAIRTGAPPLHGIAIPVVIASIYGAVLYVFLMPHLSGYGQLGLLIFLWSFAVCYHYSKPQQAGAKASMLANSISTMSIANEQTYSFASFANSLYMSCLLGALLVAVFYLPPSPRPEKIFLRHCRRFFQHSRELIRLYREAGTGKPSFLSGMRARYLEADILSLPGNLIATAKKIDADDFPGCSSEALEDLGSSLYDLAFRVRDLRGTGSNERQGSNEERLSAEVKRWQTKWDSTLLQWDGQESSWTAGEDIRSDVLQELDQLESLISNELGTAASESDCKDTRRRLFGILASYRGLAEAEAGFGRAAENLSWSELREPRF